jgi:hypothetical protein
MHRFGIPNRDITDLGSLFIATKFINWAQDCDISIDYASVTHPEANGQVERVNGLILAGLKPRLYEELEDYDSKWIEELPKVVWGLHTQVTRATGYSPFFLVYGSEAVLPSDLIWTSPKIEQYKKGEVKHTRRLELDSTKEVRIKATLQSAQYLQGLRHHYNKSTKQRLVQVRDLVL